MMIDYNFVLTAFFAGGSIIVTILMVLAYFTKKMELQLKNRLYIAFMIGTFCLQVAALIFILCYGLSTNIVLLKITYKIYWIAVYLWEILLLLYCYIAMDEQKYNKVTDILNNKTLKIAFYVMCLGLVGCLFLPVSHLNYNEFTTISGIIPYYVMGFYLIMFIPVFIYLCQARKQLSKQVFLTISFILIITILIGIFQLLIPNVVIFTVTSIMQVDILYVYFENPDLYTIKQIETAKNSITKVKLSKTEFFANISEIVNAPINTIISNSESILDSDDKDKILESIKEINMAGHSLLDIINNTFDSSKLYSNNEVLDNKEYPLNNVLSDLLGVINTSANQKDVRFIMNVDESTPNILFGDSAKLYQVLLNILSNSIKYTDLGRIGFNLQKEVQGSNVLLKFKISDSGCGISKEDCAKLNEKLDNLDKADNESIEGAGLGLIIAKKYVNLMGGKMSFESEKDIGTTFYVEVPQRIVSASPIGEVNISVAKLDENNLKDCSKYKVLIVDDDYLSLKVASRLLDRYKFQIETCSSGRDCIFKIKSGEQYDLIFLDPIMPEMDGVETLRIVKNLGNIYAIPPVVALTANTFATARNQYISSGFDDYLSKPTNLLDLDIVINKYFSNK